MGWNVEWPVVSFAFQLISFTTTDQNNILIAADQFLDWKLVYGLKLNESFIQTPNQFDVTLFSIGVLTGAENVYLLQLY